VAKKKSAGQALGFFLITFGLSRTEEVAIAVDFNVRRVFVVTPASIIRHKDLANCRQAQLAFAKLGSQFFLRANLLCHHIPVLVAFGPFLRAMQYKHSYRKLSFDIFLNVLLECGGDFRMGGALATDHYQTHKQ
jgi:hypothetical protein